MASRSSVRPWRLQRSSSQRGNSRSDTGQIGSTTPALSNALYQALLRCRHSKPTARQTISVSAKGDAK